jgi:uncharacterized iron-regulated protein
MSDIGLASSSLLRAGRCGQQACEHPRAAPLPLDEDGRDRVGRTDLRDATDPPRRATRPDNGKPAMAGRLARSLAVCLMPVVVGCSTGPRAWQESGGASHPLIGQIYRVADRRPVSEADLFAAAGAADFVLIGERHDNRDHHRLQAEIVRALQRDARRPRAVAFEMIGADRQLDIVEYLDAHPGDAAGLGTAVDWAASGSPDWAVYEPIARAALANGAQIVAADLDEEAQDAVFNRGAQSLRSSFVRRTGLDRDFPAALTSNLRDELDRAHCGAVPPEVVSGMYQVQRARDAMLADRLAAASGKAGGILIAGNDHVRNDRGVPWYLARLKPAAHTLSIGLLEVQDYQRRPPAALPYDYVWFTARVADGQDPCAANESDLRARQRRRARQRARYRHGRLARADSVLCRELFRPAALGAARCGGRRGAGAAGAVFGAERGRWDHVGLRFAAQVAGGARGTVERGGSAHDSESN